MHVFVPVHAMVVASNTSGLQARLAGEMHAAWPSSVTACPAGTFSDPANIDLILYRQWEAYSPCPAEVMFEELPDCHDYPVRTES